MTFEDIQAFIFVYRFKSISKAALRLNISQSELSKRLQRMQTELNSQLIDTTNKRRLVITQTGEDFYESALKIMDGYEQMLDKIAINRSSNTTTIKIGTVPISSQYGISKIISGFNAEHPNIFVQLIENEGKNLIKELDNGSIDAAILRDTQTDYLSPISYGIKSLVSDELLVIMATSNLLNRMDSVSIKDLKEEQLLMLPEGSGVHEPILEMFSQNGLTPKIYFQSSHIETLLGMLNNSKSVTFLFNKSVKPFINADLTTKSLTPKYSSTLQFVYKQRSVTQLMLSVLHRLINELKFSN